MPLIIIKVKKRKINICNCHKRNLLRVIYFTSTLNVMNDNNTIFIKKGKFNDKKNNIKHLFDILRNEKVK